MLGRLFPKQIDNHYQGLFAALWLFVPILFVKLLMGFNVAGLDPLISSREVLQQADGVPVERFGAEAGSELVFTFASWGLALFTLSLLGVVALIRYRAMIPLVFLLLAIEQFGRLGLGALHPIIHAAAPAAGHSPGFYVNWGIDAALALGLVLSLIPRRRSA